MLFSYLEKTSLLSMLGSEEEKGRRMCPGCVKKMGVFLNSGLDCWLGKELLIYKRISVHGTALAR